MGQGQGERVKPLTPGFGMIGTTSRHELRDL